MHKTRNVIKLKKIKRPLVVAAIGYIIGIILGLYLKTNMALLYFIIAVIAIYFLMTPRKVKKLNIYSPRRYIRYFKILITKSTLFLFMIFLFISYLIIQIKEKEYADVYEMEGNVKVQGIIVSEKIKKDYYSRYIIKVENLKFYLQVDENENLEYGDYVEVNAEYVKPEPQENYGGYSYQNYLKSQNIYGTLKVKNINVLAHEKANKIFMIANTIKNKAKENVYKIFISDEAEMINGLILGDTSNLSDKIKEDFQIVSISHILAISGTHITYIITGATIFLNKFLGRKKSKYIIILILIFYMLITGNSPSILRAIICGIVLITAKLLYRKNDTWTSMALSLLLILIYNPYLISNAGLQLSYFGALGIIIFLDKIHLPSKKKKLKESKIISGIKNIVSITIAAQIFIMPLIIYHFNTFSVYFLISNFFAGLVSEPLIILGFTTILISFISIPLASLIAIPVKWGIEYLILVSKMSNLPLAKIYVPTPKISHVLIYLLIPIIIKFLYEVYSLKKDTNTKRRIRNMIALYKYKYFTKMRLLTVIIMIAVIFTFKIIPNRLKIHFVDVDQGDCTFIVTPRNKTVLVDRWRK